MKIAAPRGTCDVLPNDSYKWNYIETAARKISNNFGFNEIRTPIFEHTELFTRGIGSGSDIVRKEMYTFDDKKGRSITLRPEGTATVMRSILQNNLCANGLAKLFYIGPFFRYERPQEGRFRQFHQFGLEAVGVDSPAVDAEIIDAAVSFFSELGLSNLTVQLNSLGCADCRPKYRDALVAFLSEKRDALCGDCNERFELNPLRVIDCKNPSCKEIVSTSPVMLDYLCGDCRDHFEKLQKYLTLCNIKFSVNARIVRGLDYYTRTVFEIVSSYLGSQDAICGGGRYDRLAAEIGDKDMPAVGFAAGIERTAALMEKSGCSFGSEPAPVAYIVSVDESCEDASVSLLHSLRSAGLPSQRSYARKNLKKLFKDAAQLNSKFVLVVGPDEIASGNLTVKRMADKTQFEVPFASAADFILKDIHQ